MSKEWKPGDVGRILDGSVAAESGCWLWQGSLDQDGYGQIRFDGRKWRVHRASYAMHVGPIPEGLVIDHLCRVRSCVNPAHLEAVTDEENRMRGEGNDANARRNGACVNGHAYTPANTYHREGGRQCRACARERMASKGRDQSGTTFTCSICGQERHANSKRRHLLTHGAIA